MIRLVPGADMQRAVDVVRTQRYALDSFNANDFEAVRCYVEWVVTTTTMLRNVVDDQDIADLLLTRGYDRLVDLFNGPHRSAEPNITTKRVVNALVQQEQAEQRRAFDKILERLTYESMKWNDRGGPGRVMIPDTNFYLHHDALFGEDAFIASLGSRRGGVRIVIPAVVIEELDKHKFGSDEVRSRARQTIKAINARFAGPDSVALLATGDTTCPDGDVLAELLLDLPGHRRLPGKDEEIRDRAVAIKIISGRPVTIVTFDLGMALAARLLGLDVLQLDPPERRSARLLRKERQADQATPIPRPAPAEGGTEASPSGSGGRAAVE